MRYISTRGSPLYYSFSEAVLVGLGDDGGLIIPELIPTLPLDWSITWRNLTFSELAFNIFSLYIPQEEIRSQELENLVSRSYDSFRTPTVTPLVKIKPQLYILELFHGPTFAFKDVALQFLGNLFEYLLKKKNAGKGEKEVKDRITVVGATSGDTGSAAIYGLRGKKNISLFILHPRGKVSPIQEAQMTTVLDSNVHNLAIEGTFDDCQNIVKALFNDSPFNNKYHLGAVNSINWARILAQITYYFHSYFQLLDYLNINLNSPDAEHIQLQYIVPTGNFGDILAGYYARRMGLPIQKLVVATNSNDILDRFFQSGKYENSGVIETQSPAMDIAVSSNFERWLWYLAYECLPQKKQDSETERMKYVGNHVKQWMEEVKSNQGFSIGEDFLKIARRDFHSAKVTDEEILETIRRYYLPKSTDQISYILDPHTAVGINAAEQQTVSSSTYQICLATAHPAKFAKAVVTALENISSFDFLSIEPPEFKGLLDREKRVTYLERPDPILVKKKIENELKNEGNENENRI
ncbi:hypothetical protein G9A89_009561 [Geosiphon pyriformis]|nr:hypothetical protein G9A89_009561 [Geosiphon pyriformis]